MPRGIRIVGNCTVVPTTTPIHKEAFGHCWLISFIIFDSQSKTTAQPSQIDFNVSKYYYGLLNPVGEFPLLFKWGFISINYRINKKPEMSAIFVQTQAALKARPIAACLSSSKEALSPCLSLLKVLFKSLISYSFMDGALLVSL